MTFIHHIGIYCRDLELMKEFYFKYFAGTADEKYVNPAKGFESYMIRFPALGSDGIIAAGLAIPQPYATLEIMKKRGIDTDAAGVTLGIHHISFKVGRNGLVDKLTDTLRQDGYNILSEPRMTGDGYYECSVEDPEGNVIEIMA